MERFYRQDSRTSAIMGGVLFATFAYLALFAAFSDAHISGGIPFFPSSWNQKLGKTLFGTFGVLLIFVSLYSFATALKRPFKKK